MDNDNTFEAKLDDFSEDTPLFNLDLNDEDIIRNFHKAIDESESFWNNASGYNLEAVRKKNKKYWMGEQLNEAELYDHNVRYIDNRVFVSTESVVSYVTAKVATPEVSPAQNSDSSKQLAKDLGKALQQEAEEQHVQEKAKIAVRHLLMYRFGALKVRYDDSLGKLVTDFVLPQRLIVDKDAVPYTNPRFMAEIMWATIEELIEKFPDKEKEITNIMGIKRGVKSQMTQRVKYYELHFTYYRDDGKQHEAIAWILKKNVLGKIKTPNWIYSKTKESQQNFFDVAQKPYVAINYLNTGERFIDDTSLTEQAISQQDIVNITGRQINENAAAANPRTVFASEAMTAEDAANITGDPRESIIVKGTDVNKAMTTIQAPGLPAYIENHKYDARNEIDNIFATQNVFRGEQSNNNTLGQDVLIQKQSTSRQDDIIRSIDTMMESYYQLLVQMMKVYYTEDKWYKVSGENGEYDFVVMRSDLIEDGIDVRVKAGSTLPVDKDRTQQIALMLARVNKISTLDLFRDLGLPDAEERYKRWVTEQIDPTQLVADATKEMMDREAFMDITILNSGKDAKPRDDVSEEHLAYHRKYMIKGEFRALPDEIKQLHIDHVALEVENLRQELLLEETQMPNQQDMQAGNQQAVQDAQMGQQLAQAQAGTQAAIMPPQPGQPSGGAMQPPQGQVPPGTRSSVAQAVNPPQNMVQ